MEATQSSTQPDGPAGEQTGQSGEQNARQPEQPAQPKQRAKQPARQPQHKNAVIAFLTKERGAKASAANGHAPGRFVRWWRAHRPSTRALGWIAPLIVTAIGGFLRFFHLGSPHDLVFDESWYVKDAWAMLQTGAERQWPDPDAGKGLLNFGEGRARISEAFVNGDVNTFLPQPETIFTHPPLGKWLIAIGMKLFGGAYPFAWRFTAALAGTIAILLVARVALMLFHNVTIATTAAIFMALDGQAITLSRTAILDGFLMVFVLGAFLCLLHHRDWALERLRIAHERDVARPGMVERTVPLRLCERRGEGGDTYSAGSVAGQPSVRLVVRSSGPVVAFSWWRLAGLMLLGIATGIKWSGGYFFAVFALISVLWDGYNRRTVGYRRWFGALVAKDGLLTALYAVPLYALTYVATWTSWFISSDAFYRHWAEENPGQGIQWLPATLRSFVQRHIHDLQTAASINGYHPSSSTALDWPLQLQGTAFRTILGDNVQPLSFDFPGMCGPSANRAGCVSTITNVGNPVVWWIGTACLVAAIVFAIKRRGDWRALAVWSGMIAGWAPWLLYMHRTTYAFYSVAFLPWEILATCYLLDWVRRRSKYADSLRNWAVTLDVAAVVFGIYLLPLWVGIPMTTLGWEFRALLPGWLNGT